MPRTEPTDIFSKLRALSLFADLDDKTLLALSSGLGFRRIDANDVLFRAQESAEFCFIVSFGSVKLSRTSGQGKETVMRFCGPSDFIAAAIMLNPKPIFPVTATAIEDSGLIQIPKRTYVDIWQGNPKIARTINCNIMGRLTEFQEDKAMSTAPVAQRIARFLLRTLDSQAPHFGNTIALKLSRKDIAERVGTTVESVIRVLSGWAQSGWIETEDQHITVLDRSALNSLLRQV